MKTSLSGSRKAKKSPSRINDQQVAQVTRRILEIEALETRLLLSGVGTGLHKKKVTFVDADGDKVTVALAGNAKGARKLRRVRAGPARRWPTTPADLAPRSPIRAGAHSLRPERW